MVDFSSPFRLGDKVHIDGDQDLVGMVTGVLFRESGMEVEVGWLHAGDSKSVWFQPMRVKSIHAVPQESIAEMAERLDIRARVDSPGR